MMGGDHAWDEGLDAIEISAFRAEYYRTLDIEPGDIPADVRAIIEEEDEREEEERSAAEALESLRKGEEVEDQSWLVDDLPSKFLQDQARHVLDVQKMAMPSLAVLAALHATSALSQNSYIVMGGTFPTGLNLYSIGIGPSGAGKDAGRKLVRHAGSIVGAGSIGGKIASSAAIYDALLGVENRAKTYLWDEIFSLFKSLSNAKDAKNENDVVAVLLEAYPLAFGTLPTTDRAHVRGKATRPSEIHAPFIGFMGTTTPDEFYKALTPTFLKNGLVGRTMFIDAPRGALQPLDHESPLKVPEGVDKAMKALAHASYLPHVNLTATEGTPTVYGISPKKNKVPAHLEHLFGRLVYRISLSREQRIRMAIWEREVQSRVPEDSPVAAVFGRAPLEWGYRLCGIISLAQTVDTAEIMDVPLSEVLENGIRVSDGTIDYAMRFVDHVLNSLAMRVGSFGSHGTPYAQARDGMQAALEEALRDPKRAHIQRGREIHRAYLEAGYVSESFMTYLLRHTPKHMRDQFIDELQQTGVLKRGDPPNLTPASVPVRSEKASASQVKG